MINRCTLLGRLARDPETVSFANGGKVCKLRLITSRSYRDPKTGEFQERAQGHNVAIYIDQLADRVQEIYRKGDTVYVEGPLETRRWTDQQQVVHYLTEVVIRPRLGGIRRLSGSRSASAEQTVTPAPASDVVAQDAALSDVADMDPFDDGFLDGDLDDFGGDFDDFSAPPEDQDDPLHGLF